MLLAPSLHWGVGKSQGGPLRTNPGEFYLQKTLVLSVQDKTSLFWELRAPGFYLPREKAPSVETTFSAGKIRSDFRSGKCLGGKFLPAWKGSPDLPGDRGEPGREKERQRFEPSSKRGSRSGAAPSPSPRGLHGNPARSGAADCSWEEQDGERKINVETDCGETPRAVGSSCGRTAPCFLPWPSRGGNWAQGDRNEGGRGR